MSRVRIHISLNIVGPNYLQRLTPHDKKSTLAWKELYLYMINLTGVCTFSQADELQDNLHFEECSGSVGSVRLGIEG